MRVTPWTKHPPVTGGHSSEFLIAIATARPQGLVVHAYSQLWEALITSTLLTSTLFVRSGGFPLGGFELEWSLVATSLEGFLLSLATEKGYQGHLLKEKKGMIRGLIIPTQNPELPKIKRCLTGCPRRGCNS